MMLPFKKYTFDNKDDHYSIFQIPEKLEIMSVFTS